MYVYQVLNKYLSFNPLLGPTRPTQPHQQPAIFQAQMHKENTKEAINIPLPMYSMMINKWKTNQPCYCIDINHS